MAWPSDGDGRKSNLSCSYNVAGEFRSGHLPLKVRTEAALEEQASQSKRTEPGRPLLPRDPAIWVVRMEDQAALSGEEFSRSLRTQAQKYAGLLGIAPTTIPPLVLLPP